ncbi:MAG: alanine--tRNA ligase [Candidatus Zambryskibacteria bacterium]|nr:alanine--tRNA ligase [Candidatus Zambryskibacteria bacterium]
MKSTEVRARFLNFFKERGHAILPSASLVPQNDPSVLFNTAGMQPLVPYLLGEKHPLGTRLANIQKCVRTGDIDEIGDNTHATFFEMMGNWSLGDYFKKDTIQWSFELLTDKEIGFGLDAQRLYVTCFEGNDDAPKDTESAEIWKNIFEKAGVTGERIYFMPAKNNWWSAGDNGPCGPDTEMFYDLTGSHTSGMTKEEYLLADDKQEIVEIWNDVFMEYIKKDGVVVGKLASQNVDTGSGFERVTAVLQGKNNIFDTDIFEAVMREVGKITDNLKSQRIISDHMRTAVFMIADGVVPSNTDQGYILRRLIRRAVFNTTSRTLTQPPVEAIVHALFETYGSVYENLIPQKEKIVSEIVKEAEKFAKTIERGLRALKQVLGGIKSGMSVTEEEANEDRINPIRNRINGKELFFFFTTFGLPPELFLEIIDVDRKNAETEFNIYNREKVLTEFKEEFSKHQDLSRAGSEQKFKGGLAGTGEVETRYHTATHLLHQALRDVLGDTVQQKGSNITAERLRFDFAYGEKMTDEQKKKVEEIVNKKIQAKLPVQKIVLSKADAEKTGALHFFGDKYGDEVSVYFIGDSLETAYSKEFCGGPHVSNLSELGHFKISKEEAVSAGVRRIKAILE